MPRGTGKRYDEAFKKETVKYIAENNKSVAQVLEKWILMKTLYITGLRNMAKNQR